MKKRDLRELREQVWVAVLVAAALYLTLLNARVRAKPDAPPEDAFVQSLQRMAKVDRDTPFVRWVGVWVALSVGTSGVVAFRLGQRLLARKPLDDTLPEPPPWGVMDFTLVFVLTMTCQSAIMLQVRPLVVLEDGRRLEVSAPLSFGKEIPVPGATGESAAVVKSGDDLVLRVPRVVESAPRVLLNDERIASGERVLHRGDRLDVGGIRGVYRAPSTIEYLVAVGLGSALPFVFVLAGVLLRGGKPSDLGLRGFTPREALRGVAGYLAMVPAAWAVMFLSSLLCRALSVPVIEHPLLRTLATESDRRVLLLLLLVAGVIAPVSEEMLFRGYLLRALRRPVPSRMASVLVSSLIFGAVHPGLSSLLPIAFVGSVFAMLFSASRERSLLAAIVCHSLFNSVNILLDWGLLHNAT